MTTTRPDLDFSLTPTRGLVACAVTNPCLVSIDAELDQQSYEVGTLLSDVCSPSELQELAGLAARSQIRRFQDFRTLKEAILKACGIGITGDLTTVCSTIVDDCNMLLDVPPDLAKPDMSFRIYRIDGGGRVA